MKSSMTEVNYYDLSDDFSKIYLEDSWVVGFNETKTSIEFLVEFVLTENSQFYATPKVGEQYCYKNGKIIFPNISKVNWINKIFRPNKDLDGTIEYGNIDSFVFENEKYHLTGEWGEVVIESETPKIIFE